MKPLHILEQSTRSITRFWLGKWYIRIVGFILSIALLSVVWIVLENYYHKKAENNFHRIADEHYETLNTRLNNYVHILRSGTGLFYSSDSVSREEWHRFVEVIDPKKHYPGIQGIGFSVMMKNAEEESLLRKRLQSEGFTPYTLESTPTLKSTIVYLEPLDERNRNAIGYDMYSEPIRREAMDRAAATREMSMSAKVTLVQEIDENIQSGFLIYFPVFSTPNDTKSSNNLLGYVYSPIRTGDFFASIPIYRESLLFDVYDNDQLLYQTPVEKDISYYHHTKTLNIGGRTWSIHYHSSHAFEEKNSTFLPILIAIAITLFILILLTIIAELARKRLELKMKTKEIKESNVWLDRIVNFSADGIHILSDEGKLLGYSPSFRTMLGYDESEMATLCVFDWDVKLDPEIIKVIMDNLTEDMITFESIFRRKDGSFIDVEIKAHTFYEEGKKNIFASSWDITEQKRAKQALLSEKELAQHYLDIVEMMILVIGTDYTIQLINRKGSEILGYTPDEAVGKNFTELFIPERMRENLRNVADGLLSYEGKEYFENPIVTKDGRERLIAWRNRPMIDSDGLVSAILSSGEDITDIRRAQEHLIERESFYKSIFASVSDAIVILENYFVIDCNEHALEIFETDLENFIGKYIFHVAHDIECQNNSFVENINRAYEGFPSETECSIRLHSYDTESKIVELFLTSFGKSHNSKLIMVVRDITHKIEEQRFLTMNARQAQMGEMISMIAHQWRQPLAIITAITSQIRMKAMLSEDEDMSLINNLIKIEQQSAHLSQTISDYRDFFRPDKPKERFHVASLIDHALGLIDHALKNNSIHFEKTVGIDPVLFSYRNELLQVIIVLLKNALDAFTENKILGGEIVFGIDVVGENCIISLSDNAGGIPHHIIKKLFIPYFTTKSKTSGTGLGLYMSKLIIEEHCNGRLNVTSDGMVTTFTITLPYQKDHEHDT